MSHLSWCLRGTAAAVVVLGVVIGAAGLLRGQDAVAAGPVTGRTASLGMPVAGAPSAGVTLVTRTFDVDPKPAVYGTTDGYTPATAAGQRLTFSVPDGDVILSVGTKIRLTWTGVTADPPDAMGVDLAAQAVQVRDLRPVRLDRWAFEVVNPYIDCRAIPDRVTTVDCTGWRVRVVVTAVVARGRT